MTYFIKLMIFSHSPNKNMFLYKKKSTKSNHLNDTHFYLLKTDFVENFHYTIFVSKYWLKINVWVSEFWWLCKFIISFDWLNKLMYSSSKHTSLSPNQFIRPQRDLSPSNKHQSRGAKYYSTEEVSRMIKSYIEPKILYLRN